MPLLASQDWTYPESLAAAYAELEQLKAEGGRTWVPMDPSLIGTGRSPRSSEPTSGDLNTVPAPQPESSQTQRCPASLQDATAPEPVAAYDPESDLRQARVDFLMRFKLAHMSLPMTLTPLNRNLGQFEQHRELQKLRAEVEVRRRGLDPKTSAGRSALVNIIGSDEQWTRAEAVVRQRVIELGLDAQNRPDLVRCSSERPLNWTANPDPGHAEDPCRYAEPGMIVGPHAAFFVVRLRTDEVCAVGLQNLALSAESSASEAGLSSVQSSIEVTEGEETYWPSIERYLVRCRASGEEVKPVAKCLACWRLLVLPGMQVPDDQLGPKGMFRMGYRLACEHVKCTECVELSFRDAYITARESDDGMWYPPKCDYCKVSYEGKKRE